LLQAIRGRPDIRRMARNPVMLTALAVVHWNERRLPEQRADLYHSIITWLSRSREQRPGRETANRTVVLLGEVALAMQDHSDERKTQVPRHWAAEQIAVEFDGGEATRNSIALAESFLCEEEVDSGIVVARGSDVSFWHLTFQEFLAAKAIAARLDDEQRQILFADSTRIYQPEWHEVVLLLTGILHEHGKAKVDGFVRTVLNGLGQSASLVQQARCAGLLGCVVRDLKPLKYKITDPRYKGLLQDVMGIFDPASFRNVPIETRIAAGDALGQAGDVRLDFRHEDYWVDIPAGRFLMGAQNSDPKGANYDPEARDGDAWQETPHEVYLDGFSISRYPITVSQYHRFMGDEGYLRESCWESGGFGKFSEPEGWNDQIPYPSRPVVGVSWLEAAAYCLWANVRLPTEAEWERTARGEKACKYPWGNEEPSGSRTNYSGANASHPTPVGIFPLDVTANGIVDMGGNVLEWCQDWFAGYVSESVSNPSGPEKAAGRVFRGGCWRGGAGFCRAAYRGRNEPEGRDSYLGFRVAAVPQVLPSLAQRAEPGT
jgi:formylglycine-generating enzyme required for sulfatase activity